MWVGAGDGVKVGGGDWRLIVVLRMRVGVGGACWVDG